MRWLDHKRRVALTGLAGSGKTVFLLSLLEHLEHFDPGRFRPATGEVTAFRQLPAEGSFEPFPRMLLRAKLLEAQNVSWPDKTRDIYRYRFAFNLPSLGLPSRIWNKLTLHSSTRVEWDVLDFPGERLSDSLMAKHASFADWSDALIDMWRSYDRLREGMGPYLDLAHDGAAADAPSLLATYKRCLAGMVHAKYQLITPSTFMLDVAGGSVFAADDLGNGGASRVSGLPDGEFSPLPSRRREKNPELAGTFSRHYEAYRSKVVMPLFDAVNDCDRLLLLIDIPGILSGGIGRLNDTNHMISTLAASITPSNWFFTNVDKMAFIASKSDMIHRRDQDNLKALVDDMVRVAKNRRPEIAYGSFTASAWVSAHSVDLEDGSRALRAIPTRDSVERVFRIPELKPAWPDDWGPEDPRYSYPLLAPPRLANRYLAPEQHNMEKVFDFIMA